MEEPSTLNVTAAVDVLSIDTANDVRDNHLRAPDFFDAKLFPAARFVSTEVVTTDGKTGRMKGKLTIRDKTVEVIFTGEFRGYGPDHRKGRRAGFHATTTIDRRDFAVAYNLELPNGLTVLGNEVELVLDIEAIEIVDAAAGAAQADTTLAASIQALKSKSNKPRPKEVTEALAKANAEIMAQGGIDGLKVGSQAPEFALPDATGRQTSLAEHLKQGPVVVVFYRGEWCPFCNLQLRALEDAYPEIRKLGASLIGITPQKQEKSVLQTDKNKLSFPLLSDMTSNTLRDYRLLYRVPESMKKVYADRFGIDLDDYNGEGRWELPVTATYIIGTDGMVKARLVDIDYTKRMEPKDIIDVLRVLRNGTRKGSESGEQ